MVVDVDASLSCLNVNIEAKVAKRKFYLPQSKGPGILAMLWGPDYGVA